MRTLCGRLSSSRPLAQHVLPLTHGHCHLVMDSALPWPNAWGYRSPEAMSIGGPLTSASPSSPFANPARHEGSPTTMSTPCQGRGGGAGRGAGRGRRASAAAALSSLGVSGGRAVGRLDLAIDLFAVDLDVPRGVDPEPDYVATDSTTVRTTSSPIMTLSPTRRPGSPSRAALLHRASRSRCLNAAARPAR